MKILVGYRGLNVGKDLLDLAASHAKAFEGEVHVVTSLLGGDKTDKKKITAAEENLAAAKKYLDGKGTKNDTHLLIRGVTAGEDILAFSNENNISEIILGVKSRSKVGKLLFGSTAQFVILKADCPVTTVK